MKGCFVSHAPDGKYLVSFMEDGKVIRTLETANYHDLSSWISNWLVNRTLPI